MKDATCPALHAAFQAAEKGVPFMPLRGLIGSDVLKNRPDWKVIDNPFGNDDPIVLLPAIKPDVALFHAPMADRDGNVWIGRQRELVTMAHAAERTVVTVEKMYDGNLLDDPTLAAGTLPGFYVESVAVAERGCWPLPLPDHYAWDAEHLNEYVRLAATEDGFAQYLDKYVHEAPALSLTFRDEELLAAVVADLIGDRAACRGRQRLADPGDRGAARRARGRELNLASPTSRCSAARGTPSSPTAAANCSTAPARAASTCSSSPAARSTARATSTSSASATTRSPTARFPGSFGSSYLYFVVPKVILFRTEHSQPHAGAEGVLHQRAGRQRPTMSIAPAARSR